MKNWKTTAIGGLTILSVVVNDLLAFLKTGAVPNLSTDIPLIVGAIGLFLAKDFNVTGTGAGSAVGGNVDNTKNSLTPTSNPPAK